MFQADARHLQPVADALLVRGSGFDGNTFLHQAETKRGKGKKAGCLDHVLAHDGKHVIEGNRLLFVQEVQQSDKKALTVAVVDGEQKLFLAGEVKIDGALGNAGLGGHFVNAGNPLRVGQEEPLGRIKDVVPAFFLVFSMYGAGFDVHGLANDF